MERIVKKSLSIALLVSAMVVQAAQVPTTPTAVVSPVVSQYRIRPQSLNGARKVAGEVPGSRYTHLPDMEEWYASLTMTPAYQKSIRPGQIARSLFGDSLITNPTTTTPNTNNSCNDACNKTILIQGSTLNFNGTNNPFPGSLRADDLNLDPTFNGALSFKPVISNFILDFNFYAGFDEFVRGMYVRVYAPFVHTKWNLNMKETIISAGTSNNSADNFLQSASAFFAGAQAQKFTYQTNPGEATVIRNPLNVAKMIGATQVTTTDNNNCETSCGGSATRNGFGEVRAEFGWDFLRCEDYHFGAYIAAAAPTGNKPKADLLFSPTVGNGKHWELGGGVTGHWVFWRSECEEHHIGFYTDAVVTHLFKAKEQHVFDLKGKPLSRYMAAAKMNAPITNGLAKTDNPPTGAPTTAAQVQFANELTPVANLTAQDINVSVGAQVDLTAWFNYTAGGFSWDLGYNLWLQTCQKFECNPKCGPQLADEKDTWVLVGNAQLIGQGNPPADNLIYPLSGSDSTATLFNGVPTTPPGVFDTTNQHIDNTTPTTAFALNINPAGNLQPLLDTNNPIATQMHISVPVVYLNADDIDVKQGSKGLSNKVWTHFSYTWDRECVVPFVGIGGEVEFGSGTSCRKECDKPKTDDCKTCLNSAVSQWGVWAKIGVQFD